MPPTTPFTRKGVRGWSILPKRNASRFATGRAPIVKTSRRIPPTPVAAPWKGSTNDGWLWLSILKTAARPSPMSTAPAAHAWAPGAPGPMRGQLAEQRARALVRAVLRPHDAEDPQLLEGGL